MWYYRPILSVPFFGIVMVVASHFYCPFMMCDIDGCFCMKAPVDLFMEVLLEKVSLGRKSLLRELAYKEMMLVREQ